MSVILIAKGLNCNKGLLFPSLNHCRLGIAIIYAGHSSVILWLCKISVYLSGQPKQLCLRLRDFMGRRKKGSLPFFVPPSLTFLLVLLPFSFFLSLSSFPSLLSLILHLFSVLRQTTFLHPGKQTKKQRSDLAASLFLSAHFGVLVLQLTQNMSSLSHLLSAPSSFYFSSDAPPKVTQADLFWAWAQIPKDGKIPLQGRKEL